jgi:hypothetical protein
MVVVGQKLMIYDAHIHAAGVWLLADTAGNIIFAAMLAGAIISVVVILWQRQKDLTSPDPGTVVTRGGGCPRGICRIRGGRYAGQACVWIDFGEIKCALPAEDANTLANLLDDAADMAEDRGKYGESL